MDKTFIDKLAYVCIKDRKLLAVLAYNKDAWLTPGGKREAGETDKQALIREVKEELNVDLVSDTINYYGTFEAQAHGKPEGTIVRMTCYTADFTGMLQAASEIKEIAFQSYAEKEKSSVAGQLIFDDAHKRGLID